MAEMKLAYSFAGKELQLWKTQNQDIHQKISINDPIISVNLIAIVK